jgi:hypothetical protein
MSSKICRKREVMHTLTGVQQNSFPHQRLLLFDYLSVEIHTDYPVLCTNMPGIFSQFLIQHKGASQPYQPPELSAEQGKK